MKKARKNKDIYYSQITYENIYQMWKIIKKTCKNRKEVFYFSLNLNTNINYIYYLLKNKKYFPSRYRAFMIFEPKPRLVMSQTIPDKIVNHFVTNYYLIPLLDKSLVDSNVATRKDKGSGYANALLKKYFNQLLVNYPNQEIYALKIDISKYFYSIDHTKLLAMLKRKILDYNVIKLIELILKETNQEYINQSINFYNQKYKTNIPFYLENKGLSIGAMTSQILAIFYLSDLDHFIKERLKCKHYIRYMDDFVILDVDKERLKYCWSEIIKQLVTLKLSVNNKSNLYRTSKGFTFLGYKYKVINGNLCVLGNPKTLRKITKKLKKLSMKDKVKYNKTLASYYGYLRSVRKIKKRKFSMKIKDQGKSYKEKHPNSVVILKEGIFYKTFYNDAKIIWYLFDYKHINDSVSFGNVPYDRVIAKLAKLDIGYVVIDKGREVIISLGDEDIYQSYNTLANKSYDKMLKKTQIQKKLEILLEEKPECYLDIERFLDSYKDFKEISR